ncbi:glycosyltransferase family 8 protein [Shewanella sp. Scap07]|uniref:glycosyltransferase n=1 Tax=Shewanella sp. Scap07 TaxID=2589987 RepID=UPI0015BCABBC|nr:glycosyltransferase [Shewanella sp. Scap07]QLE87519.1 glycosyltransferase family 8 protein [Shewanella sp. Scap07]
MKKVIFTLAIGDNPMYQAAIESFKEYGNKVGADVIVSDQLHYKLYVNNKRFDASPAWSEKLYMKELLKDYDRVLYLDADMLVTPWAENIFEKYPDQDTVYMFNEGAYIDRSSQAEQINLVLGDVEWPIENDKMVYFNSGMILTSKNAKLFDNASQEEMQAICNEVKFYDQTYINYLIRRDKLKNASVDKAFNRMPLVGAADYQQASFIHYAGRGYKDKVPMRDMKYIIDYCEIFKDKLTASQVLEYKKQAWHVYMLKQQRKTKLPIGLLSFVFGLIHPSHKY